MAGAYYRLFWHDLRKGHNNRVVDVFETLSRSGPNLSAILQVAVAFVLANSSSSW